MWRELEGKLKPGTARKPRKWFSCRGAQKVVTLFHKKMQKVTLFHTESIRRVKAGRSEEVGAELDFRVPGERRPGLRKSFTKMASVLFALAAVPLAFGALERVGPVDNSGPGGGYPAWYQDKTGLTLDFCSPTNQAEVDGGWCVLLPPDVPNPPESFPNKFFDEHFYSLANATGTTTNGGKAKLVLALEGAFGGGPPAVGDQIVFARIRVVVTNIPDGKYT